MNKNDFTVYIHDLTISDKSKDFLTRVGLLRLDDLLNCDISELSATRGINDDVLRELNDVIAHSADITSFFENRSKRIQEMLSYVHDTPIKKLGFSTRSYNALKKAGIHTVEALIQMSQKDIFELRNVGVSSRDEITTVIESIIQNGKIVSYDKADAPESDTALDHNRIIEVLPEVEAISIDNIPFSARARNALRRANIQTAGALISLSEEAISGFYSVGQKTRDEITAVISSILEDGKAYFDKLNDGTLPDLKDAPEACLEKGFDFSTIDLLIEEFGFKPARMTEWFGLSRQSIHNTLKKRSPQRRSLWTGKVLLEEERKILINLIGKKCFDYIEDEVSCHCMNNKRDDFVCLFIYENEVKCFF